MSALREWAASMGPEARSAVAVNNWGKWKTACQVRVARSEHEENLGGNLLPSGRKGRRERKKEL
jgi:hypothetical protein